MSVVTLYIQYNLSYLPNLNMAHAFLIIILNFANIRSSQYMKH